MPPIHYRGWRPGRHGDTWHAHVKTVDERYANTEKHIDQLEGEIKLLETRLEAVPCAYLEILRETRSQLVRGRDDLNREQGTKQAQLEVLQGDKRDTRDLCRHKTTAQRG